MEPGGKSELQSLLHSIPYKRLLLWGFVGAVGWQLHEFFGVSSPAHTHENSKSRRTSYQAGTDSTHWSAAWGL